MNSLSESCSESERVIRLFDTVLQCYKLICGVLHYAACTGGLPEMPEGSDSNMSSNKFPVDLDSVPIWIQSWFSLKLMLINP